MVEFAWICLNLLKLVWVLLNLIEFASTCLKLAEFVEICLNLFELRWVCLNLLELKEIGWFWLNLLALRGPANFRCSVRSWGSEGERFCRNNGCYFLLIKTISNPTSMVQQGCSQHPRMLNQTYTTMLSVASIVWSIKLWMLVNFGASVTHVQSYLGRYVQNAITQPNI